MPSYDECLVDAELRARAAYAQPGRHYHDQRHLDECLEHVRGMTGLSERDERVLRWAILWHDAVYDPERNDNEEQSAELARRELLQCRVDEADAEEVTRLILLTRGHEADGADRLGALMVSVDLAILGSDPERYRAYVGAVRREHAHLSGEDWRPGRAAVLERLLSLDPIYPEPLFSARFEEQARHNLEEELRRLREG